MATQAERRASTRGELLEAAIGSLVEQGYGGFTTADVVRRSGLSNGALFRYFPTRADLLAATVEEIFVLLRSDFEAAFGGLPPGERRPGRILELLWAVMSDPRLAGVYDIYTAARTDPWMRTAIQPVVADHLERLQELGRNLLAGLPGFDSAVVDQAMWLAIQAMQGLVVNAMVWPDPAAEVQLLGTLEFLAELLTADALAGAGPVPEEAPC